MEPRVPASGALRHAGSAGLSSANHERRRLSFLNIVRRRNTCDQLQVVSEAVKRKVCA